MRQTIEERRDYFEKLIEGNRRQGETTKEKSLCLYYFTHTISVVLLRNSGVWENFKKINEINKLKKVIFFKISMFIQN